jgi:hypothetical protein
MQPPQPAQTSPSASSTRPRPSSSAQPLGGSLFSIHDSQSSPGLFAPALSQLLLYEHPDRLVLQRGEETVTLQDPNGECVSSSLRVVVSSGARPSSAGGDAHKAEHDALPVADGADVSFRKVLGVIGVLRLALGRVLIVITERELVGSIAGRPIYRALAVEAVSIPLEYAGNVASEQAKVYQETLAQLRSFLKDASFIFSYQWPASQSQQRLHQFTENSVSARPLCEASDDRFFWNSFVADTFLQNGLGRYIVPVTDGFVSSSVFTLRGVTCRYTLVSRRSRYRAGVRFLSRGVDPQGHVANFVETEQILELVDAGKVLSWVTVRGSIPVFWSQLGSASERIPIPRIHYSMDTARAYRRHLEDLEKRYGKGTLTVVNLIDQSGSKEAHLGEEYEMAVRLYSAANVRYVSVDFHRLVDGDHYDNLSKLIQLLADDVTAELWFCKQLGADAVTLQKAVTRTNCIDCLDRTNVVQQLLAKYVLYQQLYLHNLVDIQESLPAELEQLFRTAWTENADLLSSRYTGTSAMKTDPGTLRGKIFDGITAAERFIQQTLADPSKQDATNLFLGKYFSRRIPALTKEISEKVFRVKAFLASSWKKQGPEYPVGFEIGEQNVLLLDWEGARIRVFAADSVQSVVLDPDPTVLRVLFTGSCQPKVLRFQNTFYRQLAADRLRHKSKLQLPPPVGGAALTVFMGSMNLFEKGRPQDLSAWISPRDLDVYVVSLTSAIFPSPSGFVFVGTQV